jgi:hypothetical protein
MAEKIQLSLTNTSTFKRKEIRGKLEVLQTLQTEEKTLYFGAYDYLKKRPYVFQLDGPYKWASIFHRPYILAK